MEIAYIKSDESDNLIFNSIFKSNRYASTGIYDSVKELSKSKDDLDFIDYIITTNYKDGKKLNKLKEGADFKTILWTYEPITYDDQVEFINYSKYFDMIVPKSEPARLFINILLGKYITKEIPEFYINPSNSEKTPDSENPMFLVFLEKQSENDINLFTIIRRASEKNENVRFILNGDVTEHTYLMRLIYQNRLEKNVSYDDQDVAIKNITKMSACIQPSQYFNRKLRIAIQHAIPIFTPDVPDYFGFKYEVKEDDTIKYTNSFKTSMYDETCKKMELDEERMDIVIDSLLNEEFREELSQEQRRKLINIFINKNDYAERWMRIFTDFEDITLVSDLTEEVVALDDWGKFNEE